MGACGWRGAPHGLEGVGSLAVLCVLMGTCGACSVPLRGDADRRDSPARRGFPAPLIQDPLVPQQEHRRTCSGGAAV